MINRANEVSRLIKSRRQELKISQRELSEKLGFSSRDGQFLSNVERGICQFPIKYIKKLSNVLSVSEETVVEMIISDYKKSISEVLNDSKTIN